MSDAPSNHREQDDHAAQRVVAVSQVPGYFLSHDDPIVRTVTGFLNPNMRNGLVDLTFVCVGDYVQPDGTLKEQAAITSRSRLDLATARKLRDTLDQVLKALTPPPRDKVN